MHNLLPNEHVVSLISLNQGAAIEMFDKALTKVLSNIADPNVDAETKRTVTLTVEFTPSKNSKRCGVVIKCEQKLAAHKAAETSVFFGKVEGELKFVEADPDQGMLFDKSETKKGMAN